MATTAQTTPQAARGYHSRVLREINRAERDAGRAWSRMGPEFVASFAVVHPLLMGAAERAQVAVSQMVEPYLDRVLTQTGQDAAARVIATPARAPLVGTAGDGRSLATLFAQAPVGARKAVAAGLSSQAALRRAEKFVVASMATAVADTARQMEALGIAVRPGVTGYVRMVEPGACSRCAILAGRHYRRNEGFERHPRCRCTHIPASESVAGNWQVDPQAYFDSLPTAAELAEEYPDLTHAQRRARGLYSQEDIFTKSGAEAIRAGADPVQVVNARRGMRVAQPGYNRDWRPMVDADMRATETRFQGGERFTWEGASFRGRAYADRTGRQMFERLMPETIIPMARDQAHLIQLLTEHGYIL